MEEILDEGQPLAEHRLSWKMTFEGRQPFMEDDLYWKMNYNRKWPAMDHNLWNTAFDWKHPSIENNLLWMATFYERQQFMEDTLLRKMAFYGRQNSMVKDLLLKPPWIEDCLQLKPTFRRWNTTLAGEQHFTYRFLSLALGL